MKTNFSLRKKIWLFVLGFVAVVSCAAFALSQNTRRFAFADGETSQISSYTVAGGAIRLAENSEYNGVRFIIEMSESDFAEYITGEKVEYTGAVMCDASKLQENESLDTAKEGAVSLDTTNLWNDQTYRTAAFIYGIPQTEVGLTNRVAVAGYYKLKDDATVYYTDTVIKSAAEIAYAAYTDRSATETEKYTKFTSDGDYSPYTQDELTLIKAYLPEYTVTYVANGTTFDTKTVLYGFKAEEVTAPEVIGKKFFAYKVNGEEYDFNTAVKSNITLTAEYVDKQYVYGTGIYIELATNDSSAVQIADFYDETSGKYMRGLTRTQSASGAVAVRTTAAANLKGNTRYTVVLTADLEESSSEMSFYHNSTSPTWGLPKDGKSMTVTVTTDEKGEFSHTWGYYFNNGTAIKFTNVTIARVLDESEYVYGTGISLNINPNASTGMQVIDKLENEESDLYIKQMQRVSSGESGFAPFTVSASTAAGLEANTIYMMLVEFENNLGIGNYYYLDKTFYGDTCFVYVTTDANGEFSYYFNAYLASTVDYVSFKSITIMKPAYGNGITIMPYNASANAQICICEDAENSETGKIKMTKTATNVNGQLTISATAAADLKPNTTYTVTLNISANRTDGGEGLAYYDNDTNGSSEWQAKPNSPNCTFTVTTGEDGTFTAVYKTYWGSKSDCVIFNSISIVEKVS